MPARSAEGNMPSRRINDSKKPQKPNGKHYLVTKPEGCEVHEGVTFPGLSGLEIGVDQP